MINYQRGQDHIAVDFGDNLTFATIQEQKEVFIKILSENQPVILKAAELKKIDIAVLQLLLTFTVEATQKNISWQWQEPSATLLRTACLAGMDKLLKLPEI